MKQQPNKLKSSIATAVSHAKWNRRILIVLVATLLLQLFFVLGATQFQSIFTRTRIDDVVIGEPAPRDVFADRTVTYVDEDATRVRTEAISRLVPPVYVLNDEIADRSLSMFEQFAAIALGQDPETANANTLFLRIQAAIPEKVSQQLISDLVRDGLPAVAITEAETVLRDAYLIGIVDSTDSVESDREIALHRTDETGESVIAVTPVEDLVARDAIASFVNDRLSENDAEIESLVAAIAETFAETNAFYDAARTEQSRRQAVSGVEPVVREIVKGERLIEAGRIASATDSKRIAAYSNVAFSRNSSEIVGTIGLIIGIFILAIVFVAESGAKMTESDAVVVAAISVVFGAALFFLFRSIDSVLNASIFLPAALATMILSILIHPRIAMYIALVYALVVLVASNFDAQGAMFVFASGLAGAFVVRGATKRLDLLRASVYLAIANMFILVILGAFQAESFSQIVRNATWGIVAGLAAGILNLSLLPFLEHVLNTATPFRLIELSDLNVPILKRMLTLAPGTYGHTVMVANLAESACREIGANPLIARVGAYYHDIGKIDQAEYFVENQTGNNKHDELKPGLSVAVIKSHVKIGIEKAKELNLPREVIEIIAQHHGSQLIHYFYARALKGGESVHVNARDYSYGGTPPVSREAAVVMLADGVEAASRTLKKPSVSKLEKFVWKTMLDKFSSGQMSNCELTFQDLDRIKKTFVHILAGQFHSRIEYPDVDGDKEQNRGAS